MGRYKRVIWGLCVVAAAVGFAGGGAKTEDKPAAEGVALTAFVPSTAFPSARPFDVVVEMTNHLSVPIAVSDHPRTLVLHEGERSKHPFDASALPAGEMIKLPLLCEFIYDHVPARATSRVPESGQAITLQPGETRLAKLKLDVSVPAGKCRWRLAIRTAGEQGERIGPAAGVSQTMDVEIVEDRKSDR